MALYRSPSRLFCEEVGGLRPRSHDPTVHGLVFFHAEGNARTTGCRALRFAGRGAHFYPRSGALGGEMGNTRRARARRYAERVWRESNEGNYWYAPRLKKHGTWNGYNNWYCHCPSCTGANTAKQAAQRRADEAKVAAPTR